jgi:NTE family protein
MIRPAAFLRNVPVLAGLSDELLGRLAGRVRDVSVRAGEWIMRDGDPADSIFIVCSGRVEVIDEGPPEALIRVLRRGDVLGELALLRRGGDPRRCGPAVTPSCSNFAAQSPSH